MENDDGEVVGRTSRSSIGGENLISLQVFWFLFSFFFSYPKFCSVYFGGPNFIVLSH